MKVRASSGARRLAARGPILARMAQCSRSIGMSRILVVATAGAGGDLQPLVAAALALRARGHETDFVGDRSVQRSLRELGIEAETLPPQLDVGPRLSGVVRDAMTATNGDVEAAGPIVQRGMTAWATETAEPVADAIRRHQPAVMMTSLFGVEVLHVVSARRARWPRMSVRWPSRSSRPALGRSSTARSMSVRTPHYASLLEAADLVLHATSGPQVTRR